MTTHTAPVITSIVDGQPAKAGHYMWFAWREARPIVQFIFQLRFLAGGLSAGNWSALPLGQLAAGAAAWLCGTWFVYLLNGICDQTEDRCNESARPIAAG